MHKSTVSIALATYNGEKYIEEQISSLLKQTYPPNEIIVCDDCSSDLTQVILNKYKIDYPHLFMITYNTSNLGYIKNFEKAIYLCKSDLIALCDQDDIWLPQKLEILINNIGENYLIHSDAILIDSEKNIIHPSFTKAYIKKKNPNIRDLFFRPIVTGCTLIFKKELLRNRPQFPPLIPHDYFISILAAEKGIAYIDLPLVLYRQHSTNLIGFTANIKKRHQIRRIIKRILFFKKTRNRYFKQKIDFYNFIFPYLKPYLSSECIEELKNIEIFLHRNTSGLFFDKIFLLMYIKYFKNMPPKNISDYWQLFLSWYNK